MMATYTPDQLQSIAYQQLHPDDDHRYQIIASAAACLSIATIAVAVRIWARHYAKAGLGADDYTILVALFFYIIYTTASILTTKYGLGKHLIYVTDPYSLGVTSAIEECSYNVFVPMIRTSVLLFYRRIFPQKWFHKCLWTLGGLIIAYSLAQFIAEIPMCHTIREDQEASFPISCVTSWGFVLSGPIFNVVVDIIMVILPVPLLWRLKIEKKRRLQLIFAFAIGGLACTSSIVRVFYTGAIFEFDITWYAVAFCKATNIECALFMLSACIPTYAALFAQRRARKSHNSGIEGGSAKIKASRDAATPSPCLYDEKWYASNGGTSREKHAQVTISTNISTESKLALDG